VGEILFELVCNIGGAIAFLGVRIAGFGMAKKAREA